jgi:adenylate kinase family enzyme
VADGFGAPGTSVAPAAVPPAVRDGTLQRIHIIGGPGSGKTSLARRLATVTGLPVHHLDDVARVGGGNGPARSVAERDALVERILAVPAWITEGVHLEWTEPFLASADAIVWLDHLSWPRATRRILGRFVQGAVSEVRQRPGKRKFTRFRDYYRNLRALGGAIRETRLYYLDPRTPAPTRLTLVDTRGGTARQLAPYMEKVIHCRSAAEIEELVRRGVAR